MKTEPKPATNLPAGVKSGFIQAGDIRTHYLEAGPPDGGDKGATILLIHSGEFSGRAEFSWRYNISELGQHFHVVAPDLVGFGRTDLVYSFTDPAGFRTAHLRCFVKAMELGPVHLMGNSYGGGFALQIAAEQALRVPVDSIVVVSGGGKAPDNDARKVLTNYNGRREEMREILRVLFYNERWWSDEVVVERWRASREPGIWEACAVPRLAPEGQERGFRPSRPDYDKIHCPVLIVGGAQDLLRPPNYTEELQRQIAGSRVHVFDQSRHCSHIEHAESFNRLAIEFFSGH